MLLQPQWRYRKRSIVPSSGGYRSTFASCPCPSSNDGTRAPKFSPIYRQVTRELGALGRQKSSASTSTNDPSAFPYYHWVVIRPHAWERSIGAERLAGTVSKGVHNLLLSDSTTCWIPGTARQASSSPRVLCSFFFREGALSSIDIWKTWYVTLASFTIHCCLSLCVCQHPVLALQRRFLTPEFGIQWRSLLTLYQKGPKKSLARTQVLLA